MKNLSRRSLLSAFGLALPFGLGDQLKGSTTPVGPAPSLRLIPFEEGVRAAFSGETPPGVSTSDSRRIEVGHSGIVQGGVQGCHNDRPFAGFPAGHLRIVRTGSEPGPVRQGARLYISTVDVVPTGGLTGDVPSRPLDFAALPAAPTFS